VKRNYRGEVELIRFCPHQHWAFLTLAVATLALGCHPGVDAPGVPLYPNGETVRLPRSQVALVAGPIAKIDQKDVAEQGGRFELLPGCHVVELDSRMVPDGNNLSGGMYWTGSFPRTIYAIRMKAGARYEIRRDIFADGQTGRLVLSASEEEASGATTELAPAKSAEDLKACRQ
jgi:hypothetical protein